MWCEARGVDYVLGLPRNDRLKDRVQPLMDDLRDRLKRDPDYAQRAVRGYQSFGYRTRDSWSRERRVIAKAEWLPGQPVGNADGEPAGKADGGPEAGAEGPCATVGEVRYNSRFVVTSAPEAQRANGLRSDVLRPGRGRKLDQGAEERSVPGPMLQRPLERQRTPASAERTGPCPLLHDEAPAREPPGIRHAARRSHPSTLREHLFWIPVRVTVSTRRIHLAFGSAFPYWKDFRLIWASLAPT